MPFDNSEIGKSAVSCQPLIRQVLYLASYVLILDYSIDIDPGNWNTPMP